MYHRRTIWLIYFTTPTLIHHFLKYRSKSTTKLYSRVLFPSTLDGEQASVFPGREIQMGGKILPLDKKLDPIGSLNFHKGMYYKPNFYVWKYIY